MYFHKYTKYKPSNTSICENYIKPVGIFGNYISKCPDIRRKRRPISFHRVPPGRSNKVKTYFSSVGSPCIKASVYLVNKRHEIGPAQPKPLTPNQCGVKNG